MSDTDIKIARESLLAMISEADGAISAGTRFLDVGCGSGLFSLCARSAGCEVTSFDYDPDAVSCAKELRDRYYPDDSNWAVLQGSVLDKEFLESLNTYDVVYAWGVLHHTGDMWNAMDNVAKLTKGEDSCALQSTTIADCGQESGQRSRDFTTSTSLREWPPPWYWCRIIWVEEQFLPFGDGPTCLPHTSASEECT